MAVMIGIDPHKRSHTAVTLTGTDEVLGQLRVTADRRQLDRLLAFAQPWRDRVWAVENANGLGRLLARSCSTRTRPSNGLGRLLARSCSTRARPSSTCRQAVRAHAGAVRCGAQD